MPAPLEFQQAQARIAEGVLLLTSRQWRRMLTLDDWPKIATRLTVLTAAGQKAAAERAVDYTASRLDVAPVVTTSAFVGMAADGRPLESLLYSAVVRARMTYATNSEQLEYGRQHLKMLAHTAVADAGRGAAQAQIAATPLAGYLRVVSPPCCQRCAVLAGRIFKWNEGFQRHPQCDCVHVPTKGDVPDDYTAIVGPDDVKDLTVAQRKAIDDGADMNAVINQRRGRSRDGMTTSEGATNRRGRPARLTPEAIYRRASSREEAIKLLADHGYIRA